MSDTHPTRDLFALLPAIHRLRDGELAQSLGLARGPLEELLAVFAEQLAVADEELAQRYDDLFIETCAEWVVPYIGDLIGVEALHGVTPKVASARAEVGTRSRCGGARAPRWCWSSLRATSPAGTRARWSTSSAWRPRST